MAETGKAAQELQPCLVAWRRRLHTLAEVGMDLPRTKAFLEDALKEMGLVPRHLGAGLAVDLTGEKPGKALAIRSDMDALPLREETGLPFACPDEAVHACGHDAHMAMLLGAAALLAERREALSGTVRFLFQPGEEQGRGAANLIAAGALWGMDGICGLHVGRLFPELGSGQVGVRSGTAMASMDRFEVLLRGKATHGALPHQGIDPIVMAGEFVGALQTLVSREIPAVRPAVVSLGRIQGGSAFNIIPGEVRLEGTFRAVTPEDREFLARRVEELARGVAALHGGEAEVLWEKGAPPVVNHRGFTEAFRRSAGKILPPEDLVDLEAPTLVGEDMALYLERLPGTFFFLGGGEGAPHHHPQFDLDEEVLWRGTALFVRFALDFCSGAEVP
ncbi:M20 metallopeptidase family protein [Aminomonas paucivorans]|uniref:M20 metallopeptidase family protein n=1 Tax=Aminomonas paucivorans TaxID=81412 RepID=UPI003332CADB